VREGLRTSGTLIRTVMGLLIYTDVLYGVLSTVSIFYLWTLTVSQRI